MLKFMQRCSRTLAAIVVAFFCCVFLLAVPRIGCGMRRRHMLRNAPHLSLAGYAAVAKSGDVLLFRNNYAPLVFDVTSPFSHVGIVIRHPTTDELFIFETHDTGDAHAIGVDTGGVHLHPFDARLRTYEGKLWVSRLNKPVPPAKVLEVLSDASLRDVPFDSKVFQKQFECFLWPIKSEPTQMKMYCTQFAVHVLQRLGIVSQSAQKWCASPMDVRFAPTVDGYEYENAIHLKL